MLSATARRHHCCLLVVAVILAVCSPGTPAAHAASEMENFKKAMGDLIATSHTDARVVEPGEIRNGQLPGHGLADKVNGLDDIMFDTKRLKSKEDSKKGMYCAGLILQTLQYAYIKAKAESTKELPFKNQSTADNFVDRWYLTSRSVMNPTSPERRGIVAAVVLLNDDPNNPTSVPRVALVGADDKKLDDFVEGAKQWTTINDIDKGLQRYDFLQMWMAPAAEGELPMAHAAIYLGYMPIKIKTPGKDDSFGIRIYYWSSHYENIAHVADLAALYKENSEVLIDPAKQAHLKLLNERRIGISYRDLRTPKITEAPGSLDVNSADLREIAQLFAFGLNLKTSP
jgi:hypothetical protein